MTLSFFTGSAHLFVPCNNHECAWCLCEEALSTWFTFELFQLKRLVYLWPILGASAPSTSGRKKSSHPPSPHFINTLSSIHESTHFVYTHTHFFLILPVSKVTPSTLPSRIHSCPLFQLWFWVRFHSIPLVPVTIIPSRSSSTAKRIWKNNDLQEANGFAIKTRNRGHEPIQPMILVWKKKGAPLACLCISLVWKNLMWLLHLEDKVMYCIYIYTYVHVLDHLTQKYTHTHTNAQTDPSNKTGPWFSIPRFGRMIFQFHLMWVGISDCQWKFMYFSMDLFPEICEERSFYHKTVKNPGSHS